MAQTEMDAAAQIAVEKILREAGKNKKKIIFELGTGNERDLLYLIESGKNANSLETEKKARPDVFLSFTKETEDKILLPLLQRWNAERQAPLFYKTSLVDPYGVKHRRLASITFYSSENIADGEEKAPVFALQVKKDGKQEQEKEDPKEYEARRLFLEAGKKAFFQHTAFAAGLRSFSAKEIREIYRVCAEKRKDLLGEENGDAKETEIEEQLLCYADFYREKCCRDMEAADVPEHKEVMEKYLSSLNDDPQKAAEKIFCGKEMPESEESQIWLTL